jgi:hypothetical protein
MRRRCWLAAVGVIVGAAAPSGEAGAILTMRVSPRQSFAPVNLRISVSTEPHADNRSVTIVADAREFYRSSEIPLEGDRAPRTVTIEFRSVPGGEYEISGTLLDSTGRRRAFVRETARVIDEHAEPQGPPESLLPD